MSRLDPTVIQKMCEARRKERVPPGPKICPTMGQEIQLILTEDADEALKAFQELEPNLSGN